MVRPLAIWFVLLWQSSIGAVVFDPKLMKLTVEADGIFGEVACYDTRRRVVKESINETHALSWCPA